MYNKKLLYIILTILIICFSTINIKLGLALYNRKNLNITFFISPKGSDSNLGDKSKPFATLEGARDAIVRVRKNNNIKQGKITVYLREGDYYRNETFKLDEVDSGSERLNIVYKAYKNEKVNIIGGLKLENNEFKPVIDEDILNRIISEAARSKILQYDLNQSGYIYKNKGETILKEPELFFDSVPMTLARWPNEGYILTGNVAKENVGFKFQYDNPRPLLWSKAKDIWMFGYWYHNWWDSTVKVNSIDTINKQIKISENINYGVKSNQRYYYLNILEELDEPGEWYIDRDKWILYFYPPSFIGKANIQMSTFNNPFIIMNEVSNFCIEGLTFETSRSSGVLINGGSNNKISECTFRNMGQNAVTINGGINNGVQGSEIYNTGTGGIEITGGNRDALTLSGNYADNNNIYNYSRLKKTYSAAIDISGVGNRASHNSIHDGPHTAILLAGNDNILEYNEIYSVVTDTDDAGAIYTGRDWTFRGNIIRYNYFHDIGSSLAKFGAAGVYLDDCMSSAEVYGNVFYKVNKPLFIGGGRDNIIRDNIIVECEKSICFDERGLTWNLDQLYKNLLKVPYKSDIWEKRYPTLGNILSDDSPGTPKGNLITGNVLYKTKDMEIAQSVKKYGTISDNILYSIDPGFVDLNKKNFNLKKNSIIYKQIKEFESIPFNKIGLTRK